MMMGKKEPHGLCEVGNVRPGWERQRRFEDDSRKPVPRETAGRMAVGAFFAFDALVFLLGII